MKMLMYECFISVLNIACAILKSKGVIFLNCPSLYVVKCLHVKC